MRFLLGRAVVSACLIVPGQAEAGSRIVIGFKSRADASARLQSRGAAGVALRRALPGDVRVQLASAGPGDAEGALRRLRADPDVAWAERDVLLRASAVDPRLPEQWGLARIDAASAWGIGADTGVPIAVVDSGLASDHVDLGPALWTNPGESGGGRETNAIDDDGNGAVDDVHGWDVLEQDAVPQETIGHGTHVAGIAAARAGNGAGVAGVVPAGRIMPVRALFPTIGGAAGWGFEIATAISYAARTGAKVVNFSGGGPFSHAIDEAVRSHPEILLLAAAGNDAADLAGAGDYPCELDYDIAPDDRIVVASSAQTYLAGRQLVVMRRLPDGAADRSFGIEGVAAADVERGQDHVAVGLHVLRDGRVVVAADARPPLGGPFDGALVRLARDGTLDDGFAKHGVAALGRAGEHHVIAQMAVDGHGRTLTIGSAGSDLEFARVRDGQARPQTGPDQTPTPTPTATPAPSTRQHILPPAPTPPAAAIPRATAHLRLAIASVRRRGRRLIVRVRCRGAGPCSGRLILEHARRRIATARVHLRAGRSRVVRLRLPRVTPRRARLRVTGGASGRAATRIIVLRLARRAAASAP